MMFSRLVYFQLALIRDRKEYLRFRILNNYKKAFRIFNFYSCFKSKNKMEHNSKFLTGKVTRDFYNNYYRLNSIMDVRKWHRRSFSWLRIEQSYPGSSVSGLFGIFSSKKRSRRDPRKSGKQYSSKINVPIEKIAIRFKSCHSVFTLNALMRLH